MLFSTLVEFSDCRKLCNVDKSVCKYYPDDLQKESLRKFDEWWEYVSQKKPLKVRKLKTSQNGKTKLKCKYFAIDKMASKTYYRTIETSTAIKQIELSYSRTKPKI